MQVEGGAGALLCFIKMEKLFRPRNYRPCSAVDKGAINFRGRVGNEDPNYQLLYEVA
jgi:hypothetical protein